MEKIGRWEHRRRQIGDSGDRRHRRQGRGDREHREHRRQEIEIETGDGGDRETGDGR